MAIGSAIHDFGIPYECPTSKCRPNPTPTCFGGSLWDSPSGLHDALGVFPYSRRIMATDNGATVEVKVHEADKTDREAIPSSKDALTDASARGHGLSGYEELNFLETVKRFKMCTLLCFLATFSAATDGYQLGYVGCVDSYSDIS